MILYTVSIFYISTTPVMPTFSHSTIVVAVGSAASGMFDSMHAIRLYRILNVFRMFGFLGSGWLKQRWLCGSHSGRYSVNGYV